MSVLTDVTWRQLFDEARTHVAWQDRPVEPELLRALYEHLRWAPTASNTQPLRVLFVVGAEAKERLRPTLDAGNVDKTMGAPVTAVLAWDTAFHAHLGVLAPHAAGLGARLAARPFEALERMALASATLQAGYLMVAARGLGLDVGPMGGFDAGKVNEAFFPDGGWRSFLLVNLGYGDPTKVRPRAGRLSFEEACRVA